MLDGSDLPTVHELSSGAEKISAEPGFEPGVAEWEVQTLPLCYAAPNNAILIQSRINH